MPPQLGRNSNSTKRGRRRENGSDEDLPARLPSVHDVVANHGLTRDEYLELLELQGTRCGICRRHELLRLDRDPQSGEVRGLLCSPCFDSLRLLHDDLRRSLRVLFYVAYPPGKFGPERRLAAAQRYATYLRRWLSRQVDAVAS